MEQLPDLVFPEKVGTKKKKELGTRGKGIKNTFVNEVEGKECHSPYHIKDSINGNWMPLTEFYVSKTKAGHNQYDHSCKICKKKYDSQRFEDNWYYWHLYWTVKGAKKRGISCVDIKTLDKIVKSCWQEQQGLDYYNREEIILGKKSSGTNKRILSIDRKDYLKGYELGNITLCTNEVNILKGQIERILKKVPPDVSVKIINEILKAYNK